MSGRLPYCERQGERARGFAPSFVFLRVQTFTVGVVAFIDSESSKSLWPLLIALDFILARSMGAGYDG